MDKGRGSSGRLEVHTRLASCNAGLSLRHYISFM